MATIEKKYLSLTGLETFLTNLRTEYKSADNSILAQANEYAEGLGANYDAAGTAATKVKELAEGQVAANKAAIGTLEQLNTTAKSDLVNAINEVRNSVSAGGVAATVTLTESTPTDGSVLKSYTIKQGENTVGTINIPKDMVVQSGEVVTNPAGQAAGTYIKLVLANATNDEIYVNVGTLVDIYKAAAGASQVQLAIDAATREISASIVAGSIGTTELGALAVTTAKIADGNVTKAKLSAEVQATLDKADAAAQDAQDKADAALEEAKEYADGLNDAMNTRMEAVEGAKHTHSNKGVLDGITSTKVSAWDAAEQNAKDYADDLNEAMDERVAAVEAKKHEHTNKALLDTYTQTEANLADAVSKKHNHSNKTVLDGITAEKVTGWDTAATNNHTHSNKTVLDGITSAKVTAWDSAEKNAKDYADGLNNALGALAKKDQIARTDLTSDFNTEIQGLQDAKHTHSNKALLDTYTQTEANLADAVSKKHAHDNKTVLDGITSAKVTAWDAAEGNAKDHADDLNTAMDTRMKVVEGKAHEHGNKTVLDGITSEQVTGWDALEGKLEQAKIDIGMDIANQFEQHNNLQNSAISGLNSRIKKLEDVSFVEISDDEINAMFP